MPIAPTAAMRPNIGHKPLARHRPKAVINSEMKWRLARDQIDAGHTTKTLRTMIDINFGRDDRHMVTSGWTALPRANPAISLRALRLASGSGEAPAFPEAPVRGLMQQRNYREYYVARANASRAFALSATDAQIVSIHIAFAVRYDLLADEVGAGDESSRRVAT